MTLTLFRLGRILRPSVVQPLGAPCKLRLMSDGEIRKISRRSQLYPQSSPDKFQD